MLVKKISTHIFFTKHVRHCTLQGRVNPMRPQKLIEGFPKTWHFKEELQSNETLEKKNP